jgi:sugar lactone lactonase YvrE
VDTLHDVFIADSGNDRVLGVSSSGVVTVIAGGHGHTESAVSARHSSELHHPTGVAVDPTGVVYISDTDGNRVVEVHSDGTVTTFAGIGKRGFSGDGGPATRARLDNPTGVALDGTAVYFSDTENQRVRGVILGPPPVLPEASHALVFVLAGGVIVGGASLLVSRRRRSGSHSDQPS